MTSHDFFLIYLRALAVLNRVLQVMAKQTQSFEVVLTPLELSVGLNAACNASSPEDAEVSNHHMARSLSILHQIVFAIVAQDGGSSRLESTALRTITYTSAGFAYYNA